MSVASVDGKLGFVFSTLDGFRYALPPNVTRALIRRGEERTARMGVLDGWGC